MTKTTGGGLARRTTGATLAIAAVLVLASAGALASGDNSGELEITVEEWCPPQLEGCLQPSEPCATYAETDRWMGVELSVTDDGQPVRFAEVTASYTEAPDTEREKTEWTDEQGLVSFSLRNAEGLTLVAEHPRDEASTTLDLSPTWGTVQVDQPDAAPTTTAGQATRVSLSYTVEGHGPAGTPPGTVTFDDPAGERRAVTLDAADGTLAGTVNNTKAGMANYQATGGDVCGLPTAGAGSFAVDWTPAALDELDVGCESDAVGNTELACTADGFDAYGNDIDLSEREVSWDAEAEREDDTTGFLATEGASATYLPHAHGGDLTIRATVDGVMDETQLHVGPEIVSFPEETEAGEPIAIEVYDPDGIEHARVLYEGHVLDAAEDVGSENVTLTPVFRTSGDFQVLVEAEDGHGNAAPRAPITLTVTEKDRTVSSGSTSGSSSSSSSSSSSGSSTSTATTDDTTDSSSQPSTVTAESVSEDTLEAEVDLVDEVTPRIESPEGDLSVEITSADHRELVVQMQPEVDQPADVPGLALRTFDVSASTPSGYAAEIDEAHLTVALDSQTLEGLGVEAEELELFHWTQRSWEQVDTEVEDAGEDRAVRLTGSVPSLSPFTVAVPEDAAEGDVLELEPAGSVDELPVTYRGQAQASQAGTTVHARTTDGAIAFSMDLEEAGEHSFEVEIRAVPGEARPAAVTDVGRYLDATIVGPDGGERGFAEASELTLTLDASQLPEAGAFLVPVTVQGGEWRALEGSIAHSEDNVTVATDASRGPLMGVLADTEAPRIGLEDPMPEVIAGDVETVAVASDNLQVATVRVLADGAVLAEADERPFVLSFDATDLEDGATELRFEVVDVAGNVGETARTVQVSPDEELGESDLGEEDATAEPNASAASRDTPSVGLVGLAAAATLALVAAGRRRD